MEIVINLPEWLAYIVAILWLLWLADMTLQLIQKWLDWRR